jgi:hypothetical protein
MTKHISLPEGHVLEAKTNTAAIDVSKYCHIVGKLIFLCHTRPDISYFVGIISRYIHKPQQARWDTLHYYSMGVFSEFIHLANYKENNMYDL